MKRLLLIISVLALAACGKDISAPQSGCGDIVISIATPNTKSAKDGDIIKSLRIYLTDTDKKIVRVISNSVANFGPENDGIEMTGTESATARFNNVERGYYKLYFIANSDALSNYAVGDTIDEDASITYGTGFDDNSGMPLSLVKDIQVGPGKNMVEAPLIRLCSRIRVTVKNGTLDKMVWIKDINLNAIRPDISYLFPHDDFCSGASHSELDRMTTITGLKANEQKELLNLYMFESDKVPGIEIHGGVFKDTQTEAPGTETRSIEKYSFEETSAAPESGESFLLMNKSMRYLVKGHDDGNVGIDFLASGNGPKNTLLASSDFKDYIWETTYNNNFWNSGYYLKNSGQDKYLYVSSSSVRLNSSYSLFTVSGSTTDGYTIMNGTSYLWNNIGSLAFNANGKDPQNKWLFYKISKTTSEEEVLKGAETLIHYANSTLNHVDPDLGIAVPLTSIKRNEDIDIKITIFYSRDTGKMGFETVVWKNIDNETTFD